MEEQVVRERIVGACKAMNTLGLNQGMSGNISVRLDGRMFITPTAIPYDSMHPSEIAVRTIATNTEPFIGPRRPSSEWRMHLEIFRARPEFGAIVHAHPIHCTALAMLRRGIPPCHYMIATFGGDSVRCSRYATFGTQELSDAVVEALQHRSACLMANHGMITCGRDLDQAMWRAVELETLARQYLICLGAGTPVMLSAEEIEAAQERFADYRP